jgi:acetyl esterase/lipase
MTYSHVKYGPDPSQRCELYLPPDLGVPLPVVIVVHGGYWRSAYGFELGRPLAEDLARQGVASWNIEYRRLGNGGGWPATFLDVAAAVDALAAVPERARLRLDRVAVVGHSAGGQLALWIAARAKLPPGVPGASPGVAVRGVVSQAGVADLILGYQQGLSSAVIDQLLGGAPTEVPDRYGMASPRELVPLGVPVTIVHGLDDFVVPIEQSESYFAAAAAVGDDVRLIRLPGVDHFAVIDARTPAWRVCRDAALEYVR